MERKRIAVAVFFLIVFLSIIEFSLSENISTEINIPNNPPTLLKSIPNQSWPYEQNLTNAFDLNDYFVDFNGDPINYSFSLVENITVVLLSPGIVSFYPDINFSGIRNLTFYASDGTGKTNSNLVFLFVGADDEPPQWSNPLKNRARIYQSSYVNFTTRWTDNLGLKSYYFSIDQGDGLVNSPEVNFSGLENNSLQGIQIRASPGSEVYWRFCASDTNDNPNCTSIQNFTVEAVQIPSPPESPSARGGDRAKSGAGANVPTSKKVKNFTVDPDYFKVSLKQGSTETRVLKITNIGSSELSFEIYALGVEDMILLSDETFSILPGEVRAVTLDFTADPTLTPEQYFGSVIVQSSEAKQIPVVIDVNARELGFSADVQVLEEYKQIMPGGLVVANISILNLKDVMETNMTLYFALKDLYGNIYDSNQETFLFGYSSFFERNLTVPPEANEGPYIFYVRVFNGESQAIDSDTFEVGSRLVFLASLKYSFVFILIFFLVIFVFILMVVYSRSKEKERVLNLYLMLNELRNLIKSGEFEKATSLYVRIKRAYGEKVSEEDIKNTDQLKEEIKKLSLTLKKDSKDTEMVQKEDKKDLVENQKKEEKKDSAEVSKKEDKKDLVENQKKEEKKIIIEAPKKEDKKNKAEKTKKLVRKKGTKVKKQKINKKAKNEKK